MKPVWSHKREHDCLLALVDYGTAFNPDGERYHARIHTATATATASTYFYANKKKKTKHIPGPHSTYGVVYLCSERRLYRKTLTVTSLQRYGTLSTSESIASSAIKTVIYCGAMAIITCSQTGTTATQVAKFRPGPPIYVLTEHATVARQTTGLLRGVSLLQFVVLLKWTRRMIDKLRHLQKRRSYCCGDWDDHSHEGSNQFNARAVCVEFFFENTSLIATTFHTICICAQFFAF
jgi:hypothetical protein